MAERKFNYQEVSNIYQQMLKTIGDAGSADSIAGILENLNKEVENTVNVEEEAIFGDLGSQLKLDWDNSSSNFPNFVSKFSNWATLIAQSGGDYAQFERDIAGFQSANPLGVTSGGRTDNYINTSYYNQYKTDNYESYLNDLSNVGQLYELTGVEYISTDSKSVLRRHQITTGIVLGADILGLLWTGVAGYGLAFATPAAPAPTPSPTPTNPALPAPESTPALPAHVEATGATGATGTASTPLQIGTSQEIPISEMMTNVDNAISQSASNVVQQNYIRGVSDFVTQARDLGATRVIRTTTDPNCLQFYDDAGRWIGNLFRDGNSINFFTPNIPVAAAA